MPFTDYDPTAKVHRIPEVSSCVFQPSYHPSYAPSTHPIIRDGFSQAEAKNEKKEDNYKSTKTNVKQGVT